MMVTAGCRQVALLSVHHRPQAHCFFLELTGAFQICACTHELCLLADLPPKPHMVLTLVYIFSALHGLTLPGSTNNPSGTFQLFYKAHSKALAENCRHPIQTSLANAFILELCFSFLLHLTLLQLESMDQKTKIHLVALLITALVYEGGHLTGAIFNPALAFSMHLSCFSEKFWNYVLVYWVAPCIGSVLVVIAWDEVLPLLRQEL
ncbi:hypothetical protein JRQ81_019486 [Phrynocephalus forsythii]|uniref:Aquaporin-11 n=1 Tax=Phrynocephalus forsythii TaxID=171643 RepID=A0A9Q0XM00_9SAUR|nr:hypothetical protein JRQ81_019486 [Phrynocephalus forsythii]